MPFLSLENDRLNHRQKKPHQQAVRFFRFICYSERINDRGGIYHLRHPHVGRDHYGRLMNGVGC